MTTVVLLDEELLLLAPGAGPLPHVDRLAPAERTGALTGAARSLLVRGLAVLDDTALVPAADLRPLLAPLAADAARVELLAVGGDGSQLTVLHPCDDGVLVHDTSGDGVHRLTLVASTEARRQLRAALDHPPPLGDDDGRVLRLRTCRPGRPGTEQVLRHAADGWLLGAGDPPPRHEPGVAPTGGAAGSGPLVDAGALDRLADAALDALLMRPAAP